MPKARRRATAPVIRAWRHNPPRPTLEHTIVYPDGRERTVTARHLLTIEEAAAVLDRPSPHVRSAIMAGLLKTTGPVGRARIRLREAIRFREEEAGMRRVLLARARRRRPTIPAAVVFRRLGLRP